MNTIGIIIELNPLHIGHHFFIKSIKKMFPDEIIIGFMSGNIVQRGEFAIYDKFTRSKKAVEEGIDIIVELPSFIVLNNANIFAKGAIILFQKFNINHIIFGSETNDKINIIKNVELISKKENWEKIKNREKELHSLPRAFKEFTNSQNIKSNDLLGICYLNEAKKLNYNLNFSTIHRDNKNFSSASLIRQKIYKNIDSVDNLIKNEPPILMDDYLPIIIYSIYFYNGESPILNYVKKKILKNTNYANWESFLSSLANKNFTKKAIAREIMKNMLKINNNDQNKIFNYVPRILAFSNKGKNYLKNIKRKNYKYKFDKNYHQKELEISKIISLKNPHVIKKELENNINNI